MAGRERDAVTLQQCMCHFEHRGRSRLEMASLCLVSSVITSPFLLYVCYEVVSLFYQLYTAMMMEFFEADLKKKNKNPNKQPIRNKHVETHTHNQTNNKNPLVHTLKNFSDRNICGSQATFLYLFAWKIRCVWIMLTCHGHRCYFSPAALKLTASYWSFVGQIDLETVVERKNYLGLFHLVP